MIIVGSADNIVTGLDFSNYVPPSEALIEQEARLAKKVYPSWYIDEVEAVRKVVCAFSSGAG